jgi:uncharacterized membrane protein
MALSDRERRLLAEMEAALASDDPRLQSTLAGSAIATLSRKGSASAISGLALIVVGIATLFAGLIAQITLVGVAGFIFALTGVVIAYRALAGKSFTSAKSGKAPRSFGARLQQRWEERNFDQ